MQVGLIRGSVSRTELVNDQLFISGIITAITDAVHNGTAPDSDVISISSGYGNVEVNRQMFVTSDGVYKYDVSPYVKGGIIVALMGSILPSSDYIALDGSTIEFSFNPTANKEVQIISIGSDTTSNPTTAEEW